MNNFNYFFSSVSANSLLSGQNQDFSKAEQGQPASLAGIDTRVRPSEQTQLPILPPADPQILEPRQFSAMNVSPHPAKEDLTQPNLPEIESPQTGSFEAMTAYQSVKFKEDSLLELFGDLEPTMDIDELLGEESMNTSMSSVTPKQNSPSSSKRIVTMSLRNSTIDASVNEHFDRSLLGTGITTHKKKSAAVTISTVPSTGSVIAPTSVPIMLHSDVSSAADNSPKEQTLANTDKWLLKTNSNEKPFKCGYSGCEISYKRSHHVNAHYALKHTNSKKVQCTYPECIGKAYFRDHWLLKRHIRTKHTNEKPYECDVCHKRFVRTDHLKEHNDYSHLPEEKKRILLKRKHR